MCIAFPIGCSRSTFWFCGIMSYFVRPLCERGYITIYFVDNSLFELSSHGLPSSPVDCEAISSYIEQLMGRFGFTRQTDKGGWGSGTTRLSHLGAIIYCQLMWFEVMPWKALCVKEITQEGCGNRRLVSVRQLWSFCVLCISWSMARPWSWFHTRALLESLARE